MHYCSICKSDFESETPSVLTMGRSMTPRYMCPDCEALMDEAIGSRDIEKARELYLSFMDELSGREMEIHEAFDLFLFDRYHRNKLRLPRLPYFG